MAPRVLLVDDEIELRTTLAFALEREGYDVVQAGKGGEALAGFGEADALVLDVSLPDVDGFEVVRRLPQPLPLPVVMISASASETTARLAGALGCAYLAKPFRLNELLDALAVALAGTS